MIEFLCAAVLSCIVIVVLIPRETEELSGIMDTLFPVLAILWSIPIISMTRRRLRDAGYDAKSYLWLLLPVVGWIVFLVRLCGKSVADKS